MKGTRNSAVLAGVCLLVAGAISCKKDKTDDSPVVKNYTVPGPN